MDDFPEEIYLGSTRNRGDDPEEKKKGNIELLSSTRNRGDDPDYRVGGRVQKTFYPQPRGWSFGGYCHKSYFEVLPATAGMILLWDMRLSSLSRSTRNRGDDPIKPNIRFKTSLFYPQPRGWSSLPLAWWFWLWVLPATAGMILDNDFKSQFHDRSTRNRGDDPNRVGVIIYCSLFYPQPRGWSYSYKIDHDTFIVLPATAGMIPRLKSPRLDTEGSTRNRGDDPIRLAVAQDESEFYPQPRGWSYVSLYGIYVDEVLPATAGMILMLGLVICGFLCSTRNRGMVLFYYLIIYKNSWDLFKVALLF